MDNTNWHQWVLLHIFLRGHDMGEADHKLDIDLGVQVKNWA